MSDFKTITNRERSKQVFERAREVLVGGVNSPVRAFGSVGGTPVIVDRAAGAKLWDVDGNSYIDYVCSWGALILGHADAGVAEAIADQARRGTSYGMTTELEVELATMLRKAIPSLQRVRLVSSGTEATMSAIRLARAATGRDMIVKFEGCYHGHADSFLSKAGSGLATLGIAASPGVPQAMAGLTLDAPYNDLPAVEQIFLKHGEGIAAIIVEPVAANMGVVLPAPGFLQGLREITRKNGALLIFDEVITGFRLCYGGAQNVFEIEPDLTTLGKIIGGGLPVAAYGGRKDLMERIAPLGPVYQAGTLSGNPLAMRAGIETLKRLCVDGFYGELDRKGAQMAAAMEQALKSSEIAGQVPRIGSLMTLFFSGEPIRNYDDARKSDTKRFAAFFRQMLDRGVLLAPSQFEAAFVSAAHSESDISITATACLGALREMQERGTSA